MAGDWIAMRHDLWDCPQVVRILSAMCPQDVRNMSKRYEILGALFRTWCLFDRFTEDGILVGYTEETLDAEIGIEGWSADLQHVGWLIVEPQQLIVPEFATYFGESAKRRLKDAKRKRQERLARPQSVRKSADGLRTTGQDNTGQYKKKKTPLPPSLPESIDTPECRAAIEDWLAYKRERGHTYKPLGLTALITKLAASFTPATLPAAVTHSMAQNYDGIYPERKAHATEPADDLAEAFKLRDAKRRQREQEEQSSERT